MDLLNFIRYLNLSLLTIKINQTTNKKTQTKSDPGKTGKIIKDIQINKKIKEKIHLKNKGIFIFLLKRL